MAFFARCISGNSLKGMVRGEGDDDDFGGSGGSTTPNDTAHGGSKFSSYSWKRLSAKSRSSLNSPKKSQSPSLAATSADGTGQPRAAMEPVMERTRSALTDLEAVKFLIEDWSHKHWRPATPQDQECFDRLEESDILPLVALGEGAYGSVNLCRIAGKLSAPGNASGSAGGGIPSVASTSAAMGQVKTQLGGTARARSVSAAATMLSPRGDLGAAAEAARRSGRPASLASPRRPKGESLRTSITGVDTAGGGDSSGGGGTGSTSSTNANAGRDIEAAAGAQSPGAEGNVAAVAAAATAAEAVQPSDGDCADADGNKDCKAATADDAAAAATALAEGVEDSPVERSASLQVPQLIVAVKRVPLGWNQERELMQLHRCQQCPFIVRLFGFVEDGSEHCSYVMEWAEGGDLGVMLASLKDRRGLDKRRLLMSEASARYYLGCLLLALEFMHGHGLLHRDIKPSNLLLTSDGTAKLADLGFTVALDANGHTVGCCGTAGYIAPEVYGYGTSKSRMSYGVPADIWSAGATLYQMLTGQVVTDVPEELLKKGWRPPTHPRFSHHLQDLLNRMLAVKPTARPQSATSVTRHPWFGGFDWAALRQGRMKAPYVPAERRGRTHRNSDGGGAAAAATTPGARAAAAAVKPPLAPVAPAAAAAPPSPLPQPPPPPPAGSSTAADGATVRSKQHHPHHHPAGAAGGGHRLATVVEGVSSRQGSLVEGDKAVQRSALSGCGEGSVKQGREGMFRDGASFETALGTVTKAEARAAADGAAAVAAAAAAAAAAVVAATAACSSTAAGPGGSDGAVTPLESGLIAPGVRAGQGHGVPVRCPLGVAECA